MRSLSCIIRDVDGSETWISPSASSEVEDQQEDILLPQLANKDSFMSSTSFAAPIEDRLEGLSVSDNIEEQSKEEARMSELQASGKSLVIVLLQ